MKPGEIVSYIGLDRLATRNEVRYAMSLSSQSAVAFVGACDNLRKMDADFSGSTCNLTEDNMWLAIVSQMPDSESN
jgi:hypothetical protein